MGLIPSEDGLWMIGERVRNVCPPFPIITLTIPVAILTLPYHDPSLSLIYDQSKDRTDNTRHHPRVLPASINQTLQ
jgi:hypothetical protein